MKITTFETNLLAPGYHTRVYSACPWLVFPLASTDVYSRFLLPSYSLSGPATSTESSPDFLPLFNFCKTLITMSCISPSQQMQQLSAAGHTAPRLQLDTVWFSESRTYLTYSCSPEGLCLWSTLKKIFFPTSFSDLHSITVRRKVIGGRKGQCQIPWTCYSHLGRNPVVTVIRNRNFH